MSFLFLSRPSAKRNMHGGDFVRDPHKCSGVGGRPPCEPLRLPGQPFFPRSPTFLLEGLALAGLLRITPGKYCRVSLRFEP